MYTTEQVGNWVVTKQAEIPVYGSQRFGLVLRDFLSKQRALFDIVAALPVDFEAEVVVIPLGSADAVHDYYPFGMEHPEQLHLASEYRYSFNGIGVKQRVKAASEVKGRGRINHFGARMYDNGSYKTVRGKDQ